MEEVVLPKKYRAWLTLNRACNLRCNWCYAASTHFAKSEEMTLELARNLVDFVGQLPIREVILIGGEPTIYPHFLEVLAMLKEAGLKTALVTNSLKFADVSFLEQVAEIGIDRVLTSLKAGNERGYAESTKTSGSFAKVMRAIQNIEQSGIAHQVAVTMCEGTFEQFPLIVSAVKDSGAMKLLVDTERPAFLKGGLETLNLPDCKMIADFLSDSYPLLDESGLDFTIKVSIPFCNFQSEFIDALLESGRIFAGCQIYYGSGVIFDPMGRLLACNQLCENPLGQYGVDFYDEQSYYEFRKRKDVSLFYRNMTFCPAKQCVDCKYWALCGAGCKIRWLCMGADQLLGDFQGKGAG